MAALALGLSGYAGIDLVVGDLPRVVDVNPHPRRLAGRAHHLHSLRTHAARLPFDRFQGALGPAGGGREAGIAVSTIIWVFEILLRY